MLNPILFRFFAFANAFACGFTLLSFLFVFFFGRHGLTPTNYFLLFLHDLVMLVLYISTNSFCLPKMFDIDIRGSGPLQFIMSLMLSGVAAGTAIGYVGRYGNSHTGWMQICDRLNRFCHKVTTSMILSYLSVLCLLVLTIISASKSRHIKV